MRVIRKIKWTFLFSALVFTTIAILIAIDTRGFVANAQRAEGIVVEMLSHSDGFTPVVRFRTAEGEEITYRESGSQRPAPYDVGDRVHVLYPPLSPHAARIDSMGSLWALPMIFGGFGVLFALISGGMFIYGIAFRRKKEYLLTNGRPVETEVRGVELNEALELNGQNPWRIASQWLNPATNTLRVFYSENLWFDPTQCLKGGKVKVLLDPNDPDRYYMDISFLPKLEGDT